MDKDRAVDLVYLSADEPDGSPSAQSGAGKCVPDPLANLDLVDVDDVIENMKPFPYKLRPYQNKAFMVGIQEPLMTFSMATGGGKTILFGALALGMGMKTLILVNREDLLTQHYNAMTKIFPRGMVGIVQGKNADYDAPICIGMVQ